MFTTKYVSNMIIEILIFILTTLVAYFVYSYKKIHYHFDKNGVKYLPGVPLFGNFFHSNLQRKHMVDDFDEVYKAFPDERYVGLIENTTAAILVRDPELIKAITVKDFDHFVDHKVFFPEEIDELFGNSLLMMTGDTWRDMRATLSPAFTGSKMRNMMPFMQEASDNVVKYLKEYRTIEIDVDDLARRYTTDVIASAGFGLQINSILDKNNEFYSFGQKLFNFTTSQHFTMIGVSLFPGLIKKLGIKLHARETVNFFRDVATKAIEFRKQNNVERPDMLQLMMEAEKGTLKDNDDTPEQDDGDSKAKAKLKPHGERRQWSLGDLICQIFIFFAAGFETSASGINMCLHELALNPDVEDKLYQEIKGFKERRGTLSYENLNELKYLDCVLNETFRKWAVTVVLDRLCTKDYELPPPREGGKPYKLKAGDVLYNSVNSIHMDPKYFPNPEKFDPERFNEENKHNIKPFTFMTFGMGPRICIGMRFAILEIKVILYNLILNFKVCKSAKTTDPIVLHNAGFTIKAKGGTFVTLQDRN